MFTTQIRRINLAHWQKVLPLLMAATICGIGISTANAADQRAQIGKFTTKQTIELDLAKFQNKFSDGQPITDIRVADYEGYMVVRRKGYSQDGLSCLVESAQILNAAGQPIPSGFTAPPGTNVFIDNLVPVKREPCTGDGRCHMLKNVPPGARSARCDKSDLSDNKCTCHLVNNYGETIIIDNYCYSWLEEVMSPLSDWIRLQYIVAI